MTKKAYDVLIEKGVPFEKYRAKTKPLLNKIEKLNLKPYPKAHNPSIVPFKDHYLVAFRSSKRMFWHRKRSYSTLVLAELSLDGKIIPGSDHVLVLNSKTAEDPRICWHQNRLYVVYNELLEGGQRSIHLGEWDFEESKLKSIRSYPNRCGRGLEKNWVLFSTKDSLYLYYDFVSPTVIDAFTGEVIVEEKPFSYPWEFGEIHGGSPAIEVDGAFLTFFQSHLKVPVSDKKKRHFYFMGALTFENKFPFTPLKMSSFPLFDDEFYKVPVSMKKWITFPAGISQTDKEIMVSIGSGDLLSKTLRFDKEKLIKSLQPL